MVIQQVISAGQRLRAIACMLIKREIPSALQTDDALHTFAKAEFSNWRSPLVKIPASAQNTVHECTHELTLGRLKLQRNDRRGGIPRESRVKNCFVLPSTALIGYILTCDKFFSTSLCCCRVWCFFHPWRRKKTFGDMQFFSFMSGMSL